MTPARTPPIMPLSGQNLRPEDPRGARRGAGGRRRHGRLRVLSAVAAQSRLRGGARAGRAGAGPRARRSRCRSMPPTPSSTRVVEALKPDLLQLHGKETPERVVAVRSRFGLPVMKALPIESRADLAPIRLYAKVADRLLFDAPRAARGDAARRPRQDVRLAAAGKPRSRRAVHALGRARCRQRRRGAAHHARAGGRCVLGRRARAGREGPGQNPRLHPRRARRPSKRWPARLASTA